MDQQLRAAFEQRQMRRAWREGLPESGVEFPLVSVRIATFNRPDLLVNRSIRSALNQTYPNVEVVVVGDCAAPETAIAIERLGDPRVRYYNLPIRPAYPQEQRPFWMVAGTRAANAGMALCRGEWIAPLDDDDEFTEDHIQTLVSACRTNGWDFAYSVFEMEKEPGRWEPIGYWPIAEGATCHGSVLISSRLQFMRYDVTAWRLNEPGDWNMWRRMRDAGARMGFVKRITGRHYLGGTAVPDHAH